MTLLQGINCPGTSKMPSAAGRSSVHPEQCNHLYLLLKKHRGFTQASCPSGATLATKSGDCRNPTGEPKKLFYERVLDSSASWGVEQERCGERLKGT